MPAAVEDPSDPSPSDEEVARQLEHTIDVSALAPMVERQEAADAADTLETLEDEEAVEVLEQMEDHAAALALAEMQTPLAASVVEDLLRDDPQYAGVLVTHMAPDDAADLLQGLGEDEREQILSRLDVSVRRKLLQLISYDEESAGGIMTTDFLALDHDLSVNQAVDIIRGRELPEDVHHLFVTDASDRLVGVVSLRDLLLQRPESTVGSFMSESVRAVQPDIDRETVAAHFDRYDYYMLAVVDRGQKLLGIVTVDDVIDIIRAEQTEDVQKTVGAGAGEAVYSGVGEKFRGRFPWLGVSLVMTCAAALVVLVFENLIRQYTVLAFLLPVIAALVGNAGHQALAVTLRGIVLDEVRRDRVWPLVAREGTVGLLNGVALGIAVLVIVGLVSSTGSGNWTIGMVAGVATAIAMCVGTLAGSSIPLIMKRLGFDPAQSSAIFLIMVTDAVSFSVLLTMTGLLLPTTAA